MKTEPFSKLDTYAPNSLKLAHVISTSKSVSVYTMTFISFTDVGLLYQFRSRYTLHIKKSLEK